MYCERGGGVRWVTCAALLSLAFLVHLTTPMILVPACAVYHPFHLDPSTLIATNTNGIAAGNTLEEAILSMERNREYVVYRDAETDRLSVLLRRRDGHFDLVEG